MQFKSTRGNEQTSFKEALFQGLAPDGGLYQPVTEPDLRSAIRSISRTTKFSEVAEIMTAALFPDEFDPDEAGAICRAAFPFSPELRVVDENRSILELFHGPSCAFKDFGASFLATVMESHLAEGNRKAIVLTATSGDTGSAVAQAFHGKNNIEVAILYPSGRVSPLQEQQLTTVGGNVTALEVSGSFDDCQRMVKEAFVDPALSRELNLTSANSINVGRLIPQSFYYIWALAQLKDQRKDRRNDGLVFCVPSGNFGNLTAGILAWRWGMPVNRFIAATNANDVVPEYLTTGTYRPRPSVRTPANAMDVGDPSNFERLRKIFADQNLEMGSMITGHAVSDDEIYRTMRFWYEDHGLMVCPHTAAGLMASEHALKGEPAGTGMVVTLSTAHPAKFVEVAEEAVGVRPEIPRRLARVLDLPKVSVPVTPSLESLRSVLLERYR